MLKKHLRRSCLFKKISQKDTICEIPPKKVMNERKSSALSVIKSDTSRDIARSSRTFLKGIMRNRSARKCHECMCVCREVRAIYDDHCEEQRRSKERAYGHEGARVCRKDRAIYETEVLLMSRFWYLLAHVSRPICVQRN